MWSLEKSPRRASWMSWLSSKPQTTSRYTHHHWSQWWRYDNFYGSHGHSAYMITGSSFTAKCWQLISLCKSWQKYRIHSDCLSFLCYVGWRWTSSVESSRCGPRRTEPCPWVQYNNDHFFPSLHGEVTHQNQQNLQNKVQVSLDKCSNVHT